MGKGMGKINLISRNTIIIGLLLMVVGVLGRFLSGTTSVTALIPLFFGLPIAVLGWFGRTSGRARGVQIVVIILALLGVLGTYSVVPDFIQVDRLSASILSRGSMLLLCIAQVALSGRWLLTSQRK